MTFDVTADITVGIQHDWMTLHELFAICRQCHRSTIFGATLSEYAQHGNYSKDMSVCATKGAITFLRVRGPITLRNFASQKTPEHVPENIGKVFAEGAASLKGECFNAAGAMFRLALDLTTKSLLPAEGDNPEDAPNRQQRTTLAPRLDWLFETGRLAPDLKELAACIRHDGNDGAHDGTLTEADVLDLCDFTEALLCRVYTEPARLQIAAQRRDERRAQLKQ